MMRQLITNPRYQMLEAKRESLLKTLDEINDVYFQLYLEQKPYDKEERDKLRDEHNKFIFDYADAIKKIETEIDEILADYYTPVAIPVVNATLIADEDTDDEDDDKPIALLIQEAKQENKPISKLVKEAKEEAKPISKLIKEAKKKAKPISTSFKKAQEEAFWNTLFGKK